MRAILDRLIRPIKELPDFDPEFYMQCYPDLQGLDSSQALIKHYLDHGRAEGRFPTIAAARIHFEKLNGPAPSGFDVQLYQKLNPDLAKIFSNSVQYELHFLEYGRFERRHYGPYTGNSEESWLSLLNIYDFNLLNQSWLPESTIAREEAVAIMKAEGIARLAPIARAWIFDPVFYRLQYGMKGSDADLYREWLHFGFPAGRAPNEVQAIYPLMGGNPYPDAFDWRRYCQIVGIEPTESICTKIKALETFFERHIDERARACVSGPGEGRFFEACGGYSLVRARYHGAAEAFRLAIETSSPIARLHLRRGDALKALGDPLSASESFRKALTLPDCSIWALIHVVNIMISQKMFRDAMALVEREAARFRSHELFDGFVDEVARSTYHAVADTMLALICDDRQDAVVDTYAELRLAEITAFQRTVKIGPSRLHLRKTWQQRIAMLACLDLPQCTFYRVEQKKRLLEDCGIKVDVFDFNDPAAFMSALPGAAAAIFYRVPSYPNIVEAILYAQSLGITTFFDIDDLVFTRDFPDPFESYENQITRQEYFGLCHGVALYRHAIGLCEGAIVSTSSLADTIAPLVSDGRKRTFVVPNGLDDRFERTARFAGSMGRLGSEVSIFYGSGTKAHNRDFSDIVAPALLYTLSVHPEVRLVIVGYLRMDARFDSFSAQITRIPFIDSVDTYWAVLASCDINISVLHPGPIADSKSEIKWLEAALFAVPSIVSATRTFEQVLCDGETGLIARDVDDWKRHLLALIENSPLRNKIGTAARELAMREYGTHAIAAKLKLALLGTETHAEPASGKKRILICNVYFAPQSLGGATRVVEDNVEDLIDRYGDTYEVSIVSTYKGLKSGVLRVQAHRGCAVYRIGTPIETNMDWRPFNDDMAEPFRRVLDVAQPDLVHFHCIQRLTATIVEETLRAGIPYVVTMHDAWWISDHQFLVDQDDLVVGVDRPFINLLPQGVVRPESLLRLQRLKSLLNFAAATLAVSATFADLCRRAGIANVKTCENGLSRFTTHPVKTTPSNRIVIGHVGGRSVHKGAMLVEMVLKLHDFRNLACTMVDGKLERGEQTITQWGSTPVTLRAPVDREAVDQLYAGIDVLLVPSIWPESYGLVVREAMHLGLWVIVSDRGALAQEVVEGENGFIVNPSRIDSLVSVLKVIDNDVDRFKTAPSQPKLRSSSQQLDEIVDLYGLVLQRGHHDRQSL